MDANPTTHVANTFAAVTVFAGLGILVLQATGGYGSSAPPGTSNGPEFHIAIFLPAWLLHAALYAASRRVRTDSTAAAGYVLAQLALAVVISLSSGRGIGSLALYVVWCANAVLLFRRQWPLAVVVGGTVAVISMSGDPTEPREIITIITVLMMIVLTTYLVGHVRASLARKEARELLDELSATRGELNGYANEVEAAALLSERQRMARELHDTLAQGLVGVTLQLEAADSQLEKGSVRRAREIVGETMARARETLADARKAIHDLRENGRGEVLEDVIRREASRFTVATGIRSTVDFDGESGLEDFPEVEHILRRVVTEGLTNAAKHSRARNVQVRVVVRLPDVCATVRDDGVGLESENEANGHYGILGLKERARSVGGAIRLRSPGEGGTELTFQWNSQTGAAGVESD